MWIEHGRCRLVSRNGNEFKSFGVLNETLPSELRVELQLHHVISDITGVTGIAILEAILAGERNPHRLAALRDRRIKASADTIAKSLVGDYRREHRFTLRQSLAAFRHYQELIAACDREIAQSLEEFESKLAELRHGMIEKPLKAFRISLGNRRVYTTFCK